MKTSDDEWNYSELGFPLADLVPRDPVENLEFRIAVLDECANSAEFRQTIYDCCARDPIFFCNLFLFLYEPRAPAEHRRPIAVTRQYQAEWIAAMRKAIKNQEPLISEKSRDMGFSWFTLIYVYWCWVFEPETSVLLVSKDGDAVYAPGDEDALFTKLQRLHESLPVWMRPKAAFRPKGIRNVDNRSLIKGVACSPNAGVSGRYSFIVFDEFAMFGQRWKGLDFDIWAQTASCADVRFVISTPRGYNTQYGQLCQSNTIAKFVAHWTLHPQFSKGLYYDGADTPKHRFFVPGKGHPRSPWYDKKSAEIGPYRTATELNIEHLQKESCVFDPPHRLNEYADEICIDPSARGRVSSDADEPTIHIAHDGPLELWTPFNAQGPPRVKYVIGCDIAHASANPTGRSNSVAVVYNGLTAEKVGQFTTPSITPEEFTHVVIGLGNWFRDHNGQPALVIWECNGPGQNFTIEMQRANYHNCWIDTKLDEFKPGTSKRYGVHMNTKFKNTIISRYRDALLGRKITNRSREAVLECHEFVYLPNGNITHKASMSVLENTAEAGDGHGDRVIADALAFMAMEERNLINYEHKRIDTLNSEPKPHKPSTFQKLQQKVKQETKSSRRLRNTRF